MRRSWQLVLIAALGVAGCDSSATTEVASVRGDIDPRFNVAGSGGRIAATGGGNYLLQGIVEVKFAFSSIQHADGKAMGQFHQKFDNGGFVVDFSGEVTCMAVDLVMHRAWIGGVITKNESTDPSLTGEIFQPGHDVWFRVVDYGEGSNASQPDRTTFLGFENNPTIKSSEQYCAERPWPEGDARTWPVVAGNIQVH
jgi:hypothetical protein